MITNGEFMNLILASSLECSFKNEQGERVAKKFENKNGIYKFLEKLTPKFDNFVFVASSENDFEVTDSYSNVIFKSFDMTFPFKNYIVLDGRTKDRTNEIIKSADFIYLSGGHVPTQNKFFQNINLKTMIKNTSALIVGASAGSMNAADIVYSQPELEGEAIDPKFARYIFGLGLTKVSILPHFEKGEEFFLDNKNILKEISLPDSKNRPFFA